MITILIKTETHYPVNRKQIRDAITRVLQTKIKHQTEVSIAFIGDRRMRELNRTYRKIDATTDVLSFPFTDPAYTQGQEFTDAPDGILRLGDIIISYPQAVAQAAQENTLVDDVIVFLVLHGLNHLMGIHHPE